MCVMFPRGQVCGVYWYTKQNKWSAEIVINNQKINLGFFDDVEEAIKVRKAAELKYFKEFAYSEEGDINVYN